jgi:hypothetical protein
LRATRRRRLAGVRASAPAFALRASARQAVGIERVFDFPQSRQPFLSHALGGEEIGLEEVGDGVWNIVYYSTLLGKIDERTARITGIRPDK